MTDSKLRSRLFRAASLVLTGALGLCIFSTTDAQGAPAVCPDGSIGDNAWSTARHAITQCVYVNRDHYTQPARGQQIDYNIYCPGRMTQADADAVGRAIAEGRSTIRDQSGRQALYIRDEHAARGLAARYVSTPHVFHYGCSFNSRNGVATHIKVRVVGVDGGAPQRIANTCQHFGSQNGDVVVGGRMDREYRCREQIQSSDRGATVHEIAGALMRRDSLEAARRAGGKICVLPSTDIQCAPCTTSDKLIVRVATVAASASCPAGTVLEVR